MVGPTGAGKTALAIALAHRLEAEIVGADAFQIYREIPVLTAQPTEAERAGVPHHLVGFQPVAEAFDAGRYAELAGQTLAELAGRGRRVLVVGGTGLYVRALTAGFDAMPPVRAELRAELAAMGLPDLVARLQRADPGAAALVDVRNPRRVARAIEICEASGLALAAFRERSAAALPENGIILTREPADLRARIEENVKTMFAAGVEAEVGRLGEVGPTAARAIGLAEVQGLLRGEIRREEAIERTVTATRRYAKRQLTWFRNQTSFATLDLTGISQPHDAVDRAIGLVARS